MDFGRENSLFPLILIQVKSAAKRTVFGLKDKREKAFLPFKTQLFHIQVVRYAAKVTGHLTYRSWRFTYKWCYYSERFTTSDNDMKTKIGRVKPYFMSDISLEKAFSFRWADLSLKGVINNLFNEEYQSVLSRPMPRLNYEIFLDIRPKWGKRNKKQ